uniref:Uncharacterized protein n=1 Tax=Glossina palpalis gambiensis TaxID=67801 RepID=A0A1B0BIH6_9MUSC
MPSNLLMLPKSNVNLNEKMIRYTSYCKFQLSSTWCAGRILFRRLILPLSTNFVLFGFIIAYSEIKLK